MWAAGRGVAMADAERGERDRSNAVLYILFYFYLCFLFFLFSSYFLYRSACLYTVYIYIVYFYLPRRASVNQVKGQGVWQRAGCTGKLFFAREFAAGKKLAMLCRCY